MLLLLLVLLMVKQWVYEIFLITHLACAFSALCMTWRHIQPERKARSYVLVCLGTFVATGVLHLLRILFRNIVFRGSTMRMSIQLHAEDMVCTKLRLPRPWAVCAGEWVTLGVPFVGLFYLLQAHPFSISWWETNYSGKTDTIYLLFRARTGFTRKVWRCLEPAREYWAWIDGPFGPAPVHQCGTTQDMGDYGHILMVTTGIGIAAQLPYIKELVKMCWEAGVHTQRICLVWQLDWTGDYECTRDWLQHLVKQDNGYVSGQFAFCFCFSTD